MFKIFVYQNNHFITVEDNFSENNSIQINCK